MRESERILKENISSDKLIKHCLATRAFMISLAIRLDEDEELWGDAGLLHDIDLEIVENNMSEHGLIGSEILKEAGYPELITAAVKMHNTEGLKLGPRSTALQHLLAASETLTGLIVACALVLPDKSLESLSPDMVINRMKEKAFAKGVRRNVIMECENANIGLRDFVEIGIVAMRGISKELGL